MSTFLCPHCKKNLTTSDQLNVELKGFLSGDKFEFSFPIRLPAALGQYGAKFPEAVKMEKGALVEFRCPSCDFNLTIPEVPRHAFVLMQDEKGENFAVVFNRVFGEHSSFQFDLQRHQLLAAYGENIDSYREDFNRELNFFGC